MRNKAISHKSSKLTANAKANTNLIIDKVVMLINRGGYTMQSKQILTISFTVVVSLIFVGCMVKDQMEIKDIHQEIIGLKSDVLQLVLC